ncbi:TetR/AcrR family transcriptional regulator [Actinomadura darangshiensis]|uniref:TetR/AcrR family transcriptional regulator n=1 Tax=Actinomadura darangshiensis TaxID=705336 RepID=A0A4R5ACD5_9ACTN|nr:TetR/AcrR family transcriptional regulator [Actinomadura darangshiensis]TDD67442.1 TetR/AcrR family transcriptional regulator [Actinomadura darangshiensis]
MAETPRSGDVWTRPRGGRRPKLTREAIVETAIKVADAEGLDAVSIRRIAGELGVRAMSLYTHIDAKEDLLDLMVDEVAEEVLVKGELPDGWREAMVEIANKERQASVRHPWTLALASRTPRVGPNGLRHLEQSLAAAARLTDDPEGMLAIVKTIDNYMLGHITLEQHVGEDGPQRANPSPLEQAYVQLLLESGEFPYLKLFLDTGLHRPDTFEQGLNWLLDGIEHEYRGK